jgi:ADP-ribose pyrophosphatase YjhB (NUDIX family)
VRQVQSESHERRVCTQCGTIDYRQPKLAAGVVVVRQREILLTRRAIEPYRHMWCLPAGFVEEDEGTAECAAREAREETGLEVRLDGVFEVHDYTDDPRGRGTLILYEASVIGGEVDPGDDAAEVRWFPVDDLDESMIAFEQQRQAVRLVRERLDARQARGRDSARLK